jgi:hypothetical protein
LVKLDASPSTSLFGDRRTAMRQDIAILTGGSAISEDLGPGAATARWEPTVSFHRRERSTLAPHQIGKAQDGVYLGWGRRLPLVNKIWTQLSGVGANNLQPSRCRFSSMNSTPKVIRDQSSWFIVGIEALVSPEPELL